MNLYTIPHSLRLGVNFILLLTFAFTSQAASYIAVKPKGGDGMYALFKKYRITPNSCNISHFKEINRIKNIEKLLTGRTYQLPVMIMPYNGKSITSSLPLINKSTATKVMNYNKLLYSSKLRKKTYQQSRIIWVQYYDINSCSKRTNTQKVKSSKVSPQLVKHTSKNTIIATKEERDYISKSIKAVNSVPDKKLLPDLETKSIEKLESEINKEEIKTAERVNLNNSALLKTRTVPIFGSDFEEIRIQSDALKNKVYFLVSGHGGPDPGTMYGKDKDALCEDEYAYDITLRLARKLMEHGANVHMIVQDANDGIRNEMYLKIDKDERCITGYPLVLNQRLRLTQTTDAVNDLFRVYRKKGIAEKDQLALNIHIDSQDKDTRKDVYFYYQDDNTTSFQVAKRLQNTLNQKYDEQSGRDYTGTISSRKLFVMRNTQPPTVYMELGNLQNESDQKRFLFSSNRQALAEWLYDGIAGE